MPLQRRVPKRGFHNLFKKMFDVVNVEALQKAAGTQPITPEVMREKGWIRTGDKAVKVLGNGELKKAITVHAHHFSQTAKDKIEKAGGQAIVIK